jgi:AAA15 family ATPase/GTPase
MSELLLDSLEIKGYRCFEHLTIEKLGRVNLIVGKNSVGKTALLEGVWAYSTRGKILTLFDPLFNRDELSFFIERSSALQVSLDKEKIISAVGNLFYNRPKLNPSSRHRFSISSTVSVLEVGVTQPKDDEESKRYFYNAFGLTNAGLLLASVIEDRISDSKYGEKVTSETFSFEVQKILYHESAPTPIVCEFRRFLSMSSIITKLWDNAVKKGFDEKSKTFLQVMLPSLNFLNFVGTENNGERYPIVNNGVSKERVPLKNFGDGMMQLLGIALSLVSCENGILLIDEIETGLHYSILPDVWKLIFKTAKDLNVQVFATTHSKDCIEAFTQAAIDDEESEGMLIRLERNKSDKIIAKIFDEESLETIERRDIEVR